MIRNWIWVVCFALLACARETPLPDMQAGEIGRVTKIIDGDGLVLDTGQRVRLISIVAPVLSPTEGMPEPYSGESARLLEDMALGRRVQLFYPGITRDRYDRALAHIVTLDSAGPQLWLNHEMVAQGGARVRLYSSTSARGQDLLSAEAAARESQTGLWAQADYASRSATELDQTERGFMLVTAILGDRAPAGEETGYAPACRRLLIGSPVMLLADRDAASVCGMASGTSLEIRGWLANGELRLRHPLHVTIAETP